MKQDDLNGRDAAVCYAKRAVCRYIDGLLACNHLGKYLGKDYKQKLDLLSRIDLQIPTIVRDLVINERNDIEHEYQAATAVQASHAVELAELLLERQSTVDELPKKALISLGASVQPQVTEQPPDFMEMRVVSDDPWLLVDTLSPDAKIMVLHPREDIVECAPLSEFSVEQTVSFSRLMREHEQTKPTFLKSMIWEGPGLQALLYLIGLAPRPADAAPKA